MDQVQKEAENVDDEELVQPPHIEQNEDVQMVVEADHEEPEPKQTKRKGKKKKSTSKKKGKGRAKKVVVEQEDDEPEAPEEIPEV